MRVQKVRRPTLDALLREDTGRLHDSRPVVRYGFAEFERVSAYRLATPGFMRIGSQNRRARIHKQLRIAPGPQVITSRMGRRIRTCHGLKIRLSASTKSGWE